MVVTIIIFNILVYNLRGLYQMGHILYLARVSLKHLFINLQILAALLARILLSVDWGVHLQINNLVWSSLADWVYLSHMDNWRFQRILPIRIISKKHLVLILGRVVKVSAIGKILQKCLVLHGRLSQFISPNRLLILIQFVNELVLLHFWLLLICEMVLALKAVYRYYAFLPVVCVVYVIFNLVNLVHFNPVDIFLLNQYVFFYLAVQGWLLLVLRGYLHRVHIFCMNLLKLGEFVARLWLGWSYQGASHDLNHFVVFHCAVGLRLVFLGLINLVFVVILILLVYNSQIVVLLILLILDTLIVTEVVHSVLRAGCEAPERSNWANHAFVVDIVADLIVLLILNLFYHLVPVFSPLLPRSSPSDLILNHLVELIILN